MRACVCVRACVCACVRACVCVRRRRKKAVPYAVCSRALVCRNKLYSTLKWSMVTKSGKKGRMSSILSRLHSFRNIIALWRVRGRSGGESFTELNNKTAECESLTGGVRESCVQCVRGRQTHFSMFSSFLITCCATFSHIFRCISLFLTGLPATCRASSTSTWEERERGGERREGGREGEGRGGERRGGERRGGGREG